MRCPSCNSELEPGSKFCGVCGTAVTYVGSETDGFCGNCGAVMPAGANVCPSCGMPKYQTAMSVDHGHVNSYNNDEYRGTKVKSGLSGATIAVIAASAAVVVAAAVFGYIWISSGKGKGDDGEGYGAAVTETVSTPVPQATQFPSVGTMPTVPPSYTPVPNAMGYYIFPSDRQYITQADLDARSRDEIRLILNEMYARHGYIFSTPQYRQYFESQQWYRGTSTDQNEVMSYFNAYETANKNFIIKYEEAHGWR